MDKKVTSSPRPLSFGLRELFGAILLAAILIVTTVFVSVIERIAPRVGILATFVVFAVLLWIWSSLRRQ